MKFILGKKIEMTQVWRGEEVVAVTKVAAGPCTVTQVKSDKKDGYESVQIGYGERKEKNINKPQIGHLNKVKAKNKNIKTNLRYLKEFRAEVANIDLGDQIKADTFVAGDIVNVTSTSIGKGFQGVVKRHGFKGSKMTHGNKDQQRMPGSSGATGPAHVFKGTRKAGRMGGEQVTTRNLEIIEVDTENNLIYIKGSVSGPRNGLVQITGKGDLKFIKPEEIKEEAAPVEKNVENEITEDKKEETVEAVA